VISPEGKAASAVADALKKGIADIAVPIVPTSVRVSFSMYIV
jgi:hypothetical protein